MKLYISVGALWSWIFWLILERVIFLLVAFSCWLLFLKLEFNLSIGALARDYLTDLLITLMISSYKISTFDAYPASFYSLNWLLDLKLRRGWLLLVLFYSPLYLRFCPRVGLFWAVINLLGLFVWTLSLCFYSYSSFAS